MSIQQEERSAVLQARDLAKRYLVRQSGRRRSGPRQSFMAVLEFDIDLRAGQTVALVGESGSGKSTVARLLAQLIAATGGQVLLHGKQVNATRGRRRRAYVGQVQLLLQDPFASLNPIHTIRYQLSRVLRIHGYARSNADCDAQLDELLTRVHLTPPERFLDKFPHELSGGQLQRIAIARTLAAKPTVLLLDEPVSMLDVSIRLGLLNLLDSLRREENLAMLYITHDIASARYFSERTIVMYKGLAVEGGSSEEVTQAPAHPYTQLLIASAPDPHRTEEQQDTAETAGSGPGEWATGCVFARRCPFAMDVCRSMTPPVAELTAGHWTRCWLHAQQ